MVCHYGNSPHAHPACQGQAQAESLSADKNSDVGSWRALWGEERFGVIRIAGMKFSRNSEGVIFPFAVLPKKWWGEYP